MAQSPSGKKLVRSKSGLRMLEIDDTDRNPFLLGEPNWIPDHECQNCSNCKLKFDFLKRRHHCRRCGLIYCASCTSNKSPLPRMRFVDPVRQCESCTEVTAKENEFFDKHLRILTTGSTFKLLNNSCDENLEKLTAECHLSSDHSLLEFDVGPDNKFEPVELNQILSFNINTTEDEEGNHIANSLLVKYTDQLGESQELMLEANWKKLQSQQWIACFQKAMKMIYETRENAQNETSR